MSFPAYPEYKDSGVEWLGEVPAHWEVRRLRYVAALNPPKSEVRHLSDEIKVTFLPMEAVGEDGSLDTQSVRPLSEVIEGYTYLREGDVAYAKITPCFENGKAALMRGLLHQVGFGTTELTVLRPKREATTPQYLYRVVSSEPFRTLGESNMYGAGGQKRVPEDFARNFAIAWPPLSEQEKIAYFLDHETARIDALIEEQQRLIELLQEKRQAVISHAVTKGLDPNVPMKDSGVEWLGEVPAHWQIKKLAHCLKGGIRNGISPSLSADDTGVKTFSISAIRSGSLNLMENTKIADIQVEEARPYFLDEGDILLIRGNGNIGFVGAGCVVSERPRENYVYPDILFRCRTEEGQLRPEFLVSLLSSPRMRPQIECMTRTTNGTHKISGNSLSMIRIPVPPITEQRYILEELDKETGDLDRLIDQAWTGIGLLQERRSALISAAVTGKIDVRGWEPPTSEPQASQHVEDGVTA